jgi:Fe-S-cluster-containing dehydrogenase component
MTKYGMVVDVTRCNGCYNCFLACRDEHCGNDFSPYSLSQPHTGHYWMRVVEKERGQYPKVKVAYVAIPCMQCERPMCVEGAWTEAATGARGGPASVGAAGVEGHPEGEAPLGAVYQRDDGIVLIDPAKSVGHKEILSRCPYRVIFWNEEKNLPQKCTFCAHLLDQGWKEPRCVEACPTRALVFGDLDDPDSEVAKLVASGRAETLHPEYGMGDKVTYIGLPERFVAGAVVFADGDRCGEGAEVTLEGDGAKRVLRADNYGDFEFEDLAPGVDYAVTVSASGYESLKLTARANQDVYLGDIILTRGGGGR